MHRLPDRAALCVICSQCLKDLGRGGASVDVVVKSFPATPYVLSHGLLVDEETAEPVVRCGCFGVKRVHCHGEVFEAFAIAVVDSFLHGHVLFGMEHLASSDAGVYIAHTVVVTEFLVFVPGGCFASLCGPLADLLGVLTVVGQEHAAGRCRAQFVAVVADDAVLCPGAGHPALV